MYLELAVRTPEPGFRPETATRHDTPLHGTSRTLNFERAFQKTRKKDFGLLVLGNPGSGKTTLLKRIAAQAFADPDGLGISNAVVPIPYRLADASHDLTDLAALTECAIHARLNQSRDDAQILARALLRQRERPLLYLLDGLDEIADLDLRRTIARAVHQWQERRPERAFVVSARFAGYEPCRLPAHARFVEAQVQPLGGAQQEELVRNWFRAAFDALPNRRDAIDGRADHVLRQLARSESQQRLAQNPLMLQLLCQLALDRAPSDGDDDNSGDIPQTRAALYGECVEAMLERARTVVDDARDAASKPLEPEQAARFLAIAASGLHAEVERRDAPTAFFAKQIEAFHRLPRTGDFNPRTIFPSESKTAADLLDTIYSQTSLITPLSRDRRGRAHEHGFLHHTFQEYFTARHLAEAVKHGRGDADALLDRVAGGFGKAWWQEVLLLAMEEDDVDLFTPLMTRIARGERMEAHRMLTHACVRAAQQRTRQTMTAQVLLDALA
ncbi:MAG: NACHT domain-containing protein, partial [Acidobacteriota bacterium]